MTEREKIIDVLNKNFTQDVECTPIYTTAQGKEVALPQELCDIFNDIVTQAVIPYFADALIAAGIGDVKEVEHRAEKTERALGILAYKIAVVKFGDMSTVAMEKVKNAALEQAEKELAELKGEKE